MPSGLERLTIDFVNMSMHTTLANDKLSLPQMVEIKNVDMDNGGEFRKRSGYENLSTNATPDTPATAINAVFPCVMQNYPSASNLNMVLGDDGKAYESLTLARNAAWEDSGATVTNAYPYCLAWGTNDSSDVPVCFVANTGVWEFLPILSAVKIGSSTDGSNPFSTAECVEFFLSRLWVGQTNEAKNYLRGSIVGDTNDFYSVGNVLLKIGGAFAGGSSLSPAIKGLRQYRNRMYIASETVLWRLTGTTSNTFGTEYIRDVENPNGATFYAVEDFLFYVDRKGIWQFNGSIARNIVQTSMMTKWESLSLANDIAKATATWDLLAGTYSVLFPAVQEIWIYNYRSGQWAIDKPSGGDAIRCISPPVSTYGNISRAYLLGAVTNGSVFVTNDTLSQDDGAAITASFTTGHMPIAGAGNSFELQWMDMYAGRQITAGTITNTITIDGVNVQTAASADPTFTISATGASAETFPQRFVMNTLPVQRQGEYLQMKLTDATDAERCDLRRMDIWFKVLPGRKA